MKWYYAVIAFIFSSCSKEKMTMHDSASGNRRQSNVMMLTNNQIRLANITTAPVTQGSMSLSTPVNARIVEDQDSRQSVTARVEGRIEKLYVKETGQPVRKGQPLYELYSEKLVTLQEEFLVAADQYHTLEEEGPRFKSFYEAAKRKLQLYGLTDKQMDQLEQSRQPSVRLAILSKVSGIVSEIPIVEGQYVGEGTPLFNITDLQSLWVEAELYNEEATGLPLGTEVRVQINGQPGTSTAKIFFRSPEFRNNTQIVLVRARIDNKEGKLFPGMEAQLLLGTNRKETISLPANAVIRGAEKNTVFVRNGRNSFEPRIVRTGLEGFESVEITDGLSEGDTVVVTGAYLLHSEFVLKGGSMEHAH